MKERSCMQAFPPMVAKSHLSKTTIFMFTRFQRDKQRLAQLMAHGTISSTVIVTGFMKKNLDLRKLTNGAQKEITLLTIASTKAMLKNTSLQYLIARTINSTVINIRKPARQIQLLKYTSTM